MCWGMLLSQGPNEQAKHATPVKSIPSSAYHRLPHSFTWPMVFAALVYLSLYPLCRKCQVFKHSSGLARPSRRAFFGLYFINKSLLQKKKKKSMNRDNVEQPQHSTLIKLYSMSWSIPTNEIIISGAPLCLKRLLQNSWQYSITSRNCGPPVHCFLRLPR